MCFVWQIILLFKYVFNSSIAYFSASGTYLVFVIVITSNSDSVCMCVRARMRKSLYMLGDQKTL